MSTDSRVRAAVSFPQLGPVRPTGVSGGRRATASCSRPGGFPAWYGEFPALYGGFPTRPVGYPAAAKGSARRDGTSRYLAPDLPTMTLSCPLDRIQDYERRNNIFRLSEFYIKVDGISDFAEFVLTNSSEFYIGNNNNAEFGIPSYRSVNGIPDSITLTLNKLYYFLL